MQAVRIVHPVTAMLATNDNYQEILDAFHAKRSTLAYLRATNMEEAMTKMRDTFSGSFVIKFENTFSETPITYAAGNVIVFDEVPLVYSRMADFEEEYNIVSND